MRRLTHVERVDLESQVDACGLQAVLQALADIASEKSDHIELTWQDTTLAVLWQRASRRVSKLADSPDVGAVS